MVVPSASATSHANPSSDPRSVPPVRPGATRAADHGEARVRIRVTDLPADAADSLARFGLVKSDGQGWLTIAGVSDDAIPDVVAAIVAAGGRVHAVDPGRATLEDLFMRVVGDGR